jgi:pectate lyase
MNKNLFFAMAVLVMAALACSFTTVKAPTAQPPAGGGGASGSILFQDDFSNVSSGWDRSTTEYGSTDYQSGGYRINVIQTDTYFFANPYKTFQNDVRIEVDATKIGGPDDNAFGVQCRYQDVDNFYFFYISSDGFVGIGIDNAGTITIISSSDGNMASDPNVNQSAATNHIRADCIGSTLTLYANGTQVASATDSTFIGGDVGLIAKTFKVSGTDIMFHNFFVYKP